MNGALLRAGLVDELSLVLSPSVDGIPGGLTVLDVHNGPGAQDKMGMVLESCQVLEAGSSGCGTASPGIGNHCCVGEGVCV